MYFGKARGVEFLPESFRVIGLVGKHAFPGAVGVVARVVRGHRHLPENPRRIIKCYIIWARRSRCFCARELWQKKEQKSGKNKSVHRISSVFFDDITQ